MDYPPQLRGGKGGPYNTSETYGGDQVNFILIQPKSLDTRLTGICILNKSQFTKQGMGSANRRERCQRYYVLKEFKSTEQTNWAWHTLLICCFCCKRSSHPDLLRG